MRAVITIRTVPDDAIYRAISWIFIREFLENLDGAGKIIGISTKGKGICSPVMKFCLRDSMTGRKHNGTADTTDQQS